MMLIDSCENSNVVVDGSMVEIIKTNVSASGTPVTYFVVVVGQFPPVMFATVFDDLYDSSGAQSRHKHYVLYKSMLIFREFFNKQSDQNILQNTPNCTIFSKFSQGS